MSKPNFAEILKEATEAANAAGDKWVAEHTVPTIEVYNANIFDKPVGNCIGKLLDVCGFAHVRIDDKRTAFAKYVKTIQRDGYNNALFLNHKYRMRQEWSLNEATAYAILGVLKNHGIKGVSVYSRID